MITAYRFNSWFEKIISIFIDIFFIAVPLVCLYVFTSLFSGILRYLLFLLLVAIYFLLIYFFKDKIKKVIDNVIRKLSCVDEKKMLLILIVTMIGLKVLYTIFFNYDGTQEGDISIYKEIADTIIETGKLESKAISHLYGVALHYVVFSVLGIPLHVGMFIVILCGVVVSFISFKDIIGKEKAFIVTMAYALMPSTSMMSFSPTHEVFVFMYVSIFLYFFNKLIKEKSKKKIVLYSLTVILTTVLTCLVNPGGYIIYVIMILNILFTNIENKKKLVIVVSLVATLLSSSMVSKVLDINKTSTTMNTYTILIHGANHESLGEQVDGYPHKMMRMYIYEYNLPFTQESFDLAAREVLLRQYRYLITHPVDLIRLIVHKFYILWSGVHYPLEFAYCFDAYSSAVYYVLLIINTLIYLFMVSIGFAYRKKNMENDVVISNYMLELLGVVALTMLCIVVNKYSLYATVFIYLIAFHRSEFN